MGSAPGRTRHFAFSGRRSPATDWIDFEDDQRVPNRIQAELGLLLRTGVELRWSLAP